MVETGLVNKWIIVHDGTTCILAQYNDNQTTISNYTIELFDTEDEMIARITELGMTIPAPAEAPADNE